MLSFQTSSNGFELTQPAPNRHQQQQQQADNFFHSYHGSSTSTSSTCAALGLKSCLRDVKQREFGVSEEEKRSIDRVA
ncbi:hypothetical protein Ciccas_005210 [Cichlidogyrus casuarinus]|uniref:Uncharacterized protein n=1 Tax=Cichlidogyrus casuarinus TaxID=1844966 RepID=A0ABD2Q9I8_9PLAT